MELGKNIEAEQLKLHQEALNRIVESFEELASDSSLQPCHCSEIVDPPCSYCVAKPLTGTTPQPMNLLGFCIGDKDGKFDMDFATYAPEDLDKVVRCEVEEQDEAYPRHAPHRIIEIYSRDPGPIS